eukprot:COSAG01_NODE_1255_length_11040_cov_67.549584_12_plen_237_part_00
MLDHHHQHQAAPRQFLAPPHAAWQQLLREIAAEPNAAEPRREDSGLLLLLQLQRCAFRELSRHGPIVSPAYRPWRRRLRALAADKLKRSAPEPTVPAERAALVVVCLVALWQPYRRWPLHRPAAGPPCLLLLLRAGFAARGPFAPSRERRRHLHSSAAVRSCCGDVSPTAGGPAREERSSDGRRSGRRRRGAAMRHAARAASSQHTSCMRGGRMIQWLQAFSVGRRFTGDCEAPYR